MTNIMTFTSTQNKGIAALKDVSVIIPPAVKVLDDVALQCHYDLEGEILYTVKWYKGPHEFFRFIPKELPNKMVFRQPGINVDVSKSSSTTVVLKNVQFEGTGRYQCEVSTDAPYFDTNMDSGFLYVVDIPEEDPEVVIHKGEFGHSLEANCTAPPSFPPANITWLLNGEKISSTTQVSERMEGNSLKKSRVPLVSFSTLELDIDSRALQGGKAILTCKVAIFNVYERAKEVVLEEERPAPRPSSVLSTLNSTSATSALHGELLFVTLLVPSFIIIR
ncbi:hypothetical protein JTB14_034063 [Gonioctena quinquepunctata]|nr:hypothetical protein JTB14_034063 [Gonioctena quinquepunctata]